MSSEEPKTTPKRTQKQVKTPAKPPARAQRPRGEGSDRTDETRKYYETHSAAIKARATARYRAKTVAERFELRWRQEARPPTPRPGSTRSTNTRKLAVADAYCEFSDIDEVVRTYTACAIMNELNMGKYHCDHTVPLISKLVCGLHTHTNIRVIAVKENRAKGNTFWPQMWLQDWSTMDLLLAAP